MDTASQQKLYQRHFKRRLFSTGDAEADECLALTGDAHLLAVDGDRQLINANWQTRRRLNEEEEEEDECVLRFVESSPPKVEDEMIFELQQVDETSSTAEPNSQQPPAAWFQDKATLETAKRPSQVDKLETSAEASKPQTDNNISKSNNIDNGAQQTQQPSENKAPSAINLCSNTNNIVSNGKQYQQQQQQQQQQLRFRQIQNPVKVSRPDGNDSLSLSFRVRFNLKR